MGKPNNASNPDTDITELVTKHINNLDDKGKLQLPDNMPDWQKHVIRAEKRQRDAQSELGKTQKQLRETSAANEVLLKTASTIVPEDFQLGEDEIKQLEALKFKDPDAYRLKVNDLEAKAKEAQATKLAELTEEAKKDAANQYMAKTQTQVLQEFKEANPTLAITDEVLANDVPPRLINGYKDGKYDYGTYLSMVKDYLNSGVAIGQPNGGSDLPNLSNQAGGTTPGKRAAEAQGKKDYGRMSF